MGRLIDADKFINWLDCGHLRNPSEKCLSELNVKQMIDGQPTAYDVDKVVEQLEEMRDELLHSTDYNNDIINYYLDWFDVAIEIVKGAVKHESHPQASNHGR